MPLNVMASSGVDPDVGGNKPGGSGIVTPSLFVGRVVGGSSCGLGGIGFGAGGLVIIPCSGSSDPGFVTSGSG